MSVVVRTYVGVRIARRFISRTQRRGLLAVCGMILHASLMRLLVTVLAQRRRRRRLFAARLAWRTRFPALARRGFVALATFAAATAAAALSAAAPTFTVFALARRNRFTLRDRRNDGIAGLSRINRSARLARSALLLTFALAVALTLPLTLAPAISSFTAHTVAFFLTALLRCAALSTGLVGIALTLALALTLSFALTLALSVAAIRASAFTTARPAVTIASARSTSRFAWSFAGFRAHRRGRRLRGLGAKPSEHFV